MLSKQEKLMNNLIHEKYVDINSQIIEVLSLKLFRSFPLFNLIFLFTFLLVGFGSVSVHAEEKKLVVANIKLQGLAIGIHEDEAMKIMKKRGYALVASSTYGSSYSKRLHDGTQKTIDYYVAVPGAKDDQFRRITHISYSQVYPKTVHFDIKEAHSDLQNRLGQADESSINSSKNYSTSSRDNFKLKYYDDGGVQQQAPMLWIEGSMFLKRGSLSIDMFWNGLSNRLAGEYRAKLEKEEKSFDQQKGKAIIDF